MRKTQKFFGILGIAGLLSFTFFPLTYLQEVKAASVVLYGDLSADGGFPVTPGTITSAPDVALGSTNTDIYFSFTPSAEYGAGDTVTFLFDGFTAGTLATCAATTSDADLDLSNDVSGTVSFTTIGTSPAATFTMIAATTGAVANGVEFCVRASSVPATAGNYSVSYWDEKSAAENDYGATLVYVGEDNDVLIEAVVSSGLALAIKLPDTVTTLDTVGVSDTDDASACVSLSGTDGTSGMGVIDSSTIGECSYRIAGGTNNASGMNITVLADTYLTSGSHDITETGSDVSAGTENYTFQASGTGLTIAGTYNTQEPVPSTDDGDVETQIFNTTAPIDVTTETDWMTLTHRLGISTSTPSGAYSSTLTVRAYSNS